MSNLSAFQNKTLDRHWTGSQKAVELVSALHLHLMAVEASAEKAKL